MATAKLNGFIVLETMTANLKMVMCICGILNKGETK
jgi:hypothetical protein